MSEPRDAAPLGAAPAATPVHVAIIMDGNGRWAKARGLPRVAGHRRGVDAVRAAIEAAGDHGVRYLTLFGFSFAALGFGTELGLFGLDVSPLGLQLGAVGRALAVGGDPHQMVLC